MAVLLWNKHLISWLLQSSRAHFSRLLLCSRPQISVLCCSEADLVFSWLCSGETEFVIHGYAVVQKTSYFLAILLWSRPHASWLCCNEGNLIVHGWVTVKQTSCFIIVKQWNRHISCLCCYETDVTFHDCGAVKHTCFMFSETYSMIFLQ